MATVIVQYLYARSYSVYTLHVLDNVVYESYAVVETCCRLAYDTRESWA
jgi:hypothetical protein